MGRYGATLGGESVMLNSRPSLFLMIVLVVGAVVIVDVVVSNTGHVLIQLFLAFGSPYFFV